MITGICLRVSFPLINLSTSWPFFLGRFTSSSTRSGCSASRCLPLFIRKSELVGKSVHIGILHSQNSITNSFFVIFQVSGFFLLVSPLFCTIRRRRGFLWNWSFPALCYWGALLDDVPLARTGTFATVEFFCTKILVFLQVANIVLQSLAIVRVHVKIWKAR